jgi:hypothetical protein
MSFPVVLMRISGFSGREKAEISFGGTQIDWRTFGWMNTSGKVIEVDRETVSLAILKLHLLEGFCI